jgi:NADH:ubiquinone reductase (H+-translocating)
VAATQRVLILGAGPGGLRAAVELDRRLIGRDDVELTLVDPRDYHEVRLRLPEVAGGARSPREATIPLASLLGRRRIATQRADVLALDLDRRRVTTSAGVVGYRWLVLALPPSHRPPPGPGDTWRPDSVDAARRLAEAVAENVRQSAWKIDPADTRRLATVVVRGDDYAAVETAAWLAERIRALATHHRLPPGTARVVLVAPADRPLPDSDRPLGDAVLGALGRLGVEVRTGVDVVAREPFLVYLTTGEPLSAATFVDLSRGIAPGVVRDAGALVDAVGRIVVDRELRLPGHPEAFALGLGVAVAGEGVNPLPREWRLEVDQADVVAANVAAGSNIDAAREYRSPPEAPDVVLTLGASETVATARGVLLGSWLAVPLRPLALAAYVEAIGGAAGLLGALAGGKLG